MGLYDRDYMREKTKYRYSKTPPENTKLIVIAIISFILGFVIGKII